MYTRKQAIENYVNQMNEIELMELVRNLSTWDEMARDIRCSVPDIIEYLQNEEEGHTGDETLDDIIEAGKYYGFNDNYELI